MIGAVPAGLDHLLYVAADLDEGTERIERLLGVRPMIGGRHPDLGTHNALVALGTDTYLEVIAPDLDLPEPARGRLFDRHAFRQPRLATWVLRDEDIDERVSSARGKGVDLGEVAAGHRRRPDGTSVSWKVSDPYAMPFDGAVPFVIAWGNSPHPATMAPRGGDLVSLSFEHPDPDALRRSLAALGVDAKVEWGNATRLVAAIRTDAGEVKVW
jgi:hypothetical protein